MVLKNHAELELYSDEKGFMISEKVSFYYYGIFDIWMNMMVVAYLQNVKIVLFSTVKCQNIHMYIFSKMQFFLAK